MHICKQYSLFQANAFGFDPYKSFAKNDDNFTSEAAPISMKVIGDPNAKVNFKASSKANVSIPKETVEVGPEGVLSNYGILDPDSFMKVCSESLVLPFILL